MVKKVAPPAGSPVRARGVKKQGSNRWLKVPAKACSICRQTTHEADRDFREFVWLEWIQRHFTTDGAEHPSGNECYRCFHCRRRHFKEFKTLKNLAGEMEKDPSLRDKFEEARKDDIQQTGQWSGIQITPGLPDIKAPPNTAAEAIRVAQLAANITKSNPHNLQSLCVICVVDKKVGKQKYCQACRKKVEAAEAHAVDMDKKRDDETTPKQ